MVRLGQVIFDLIERVRVNAFQKLVAVRLVEEKRREEKREEKRREEKRREEKRREEKEGDVFTGGACGEKWKQRR